MLSGKGSNLPLASSYAAETTKGGWLLFSRFTALINMEDLISTDIAEVPQVRWFLLLVVV